MLERALGSVYVAPFGARTGDQLAGYSSEIEKPPFEVREAFLDAMTSGRGYKAACEASGLSYRDAERLYRYDADFAAAWDDAEAVEVRLARDALFQRGVVGWEEPVWCKGEQVGTRRRFSDTALVKYLEAHCPERFSPMVHHRISVASAAGRRAPTVLQAADQEGLAKLREMFLAVRGGGGLEEAEAALGDEGPALGGAEAGGEMEAEGRLLGPAEPEGGEGPCGE
jgi:hypothetical protein